jgi:hypothetical protein
MSIDSIVIFCPDPCECIAMSQRKGKGGNLGTTKIEAGIQQPEAEGPLHLVCFTLNSISNHYVYTTIYANMIVIVV